MSLVLLLGTECFVSAIVTEEGCSSLLFHVW